MIHEVTNREAIGQFRGVPHMVAVIMRDHHPIENGNSGLFENGADAVGVARDRRAGRILRRCVRHALVPRESRIHQHGLARRSHKERGLAALGIDEINIERALALALLPRNLRM
jgi:hypothetical protein